jgi:hypothetical protein
MSEEYYSEWEDASESRLLYQEKEMHSRKHDKAHDDSWDEDREPKNKKRNRWRDIEDRLERKRTSRNSDWNYDDYD